MAWEHLSITKPHLVYIILGGFTSIFMLCSSVIKERMYIGEATVATICGLIFGPHAADLINPLSWGNVDIVTIEFSRIVLVVQCFAVGVELPKFYMERHWKSVVFLLVPVMTFGWLVTGLFVWWMVPPLSWLESLVVAACVTATDPVLASSVVGKGKFAKRVPKHLRDLLSAESGCNDGMAFPFIYLSLYLIQDHQDPAQVTLHWVVYTILYECIFGAFFGFMIGYLARHGIKFAEKHDLIDRESFLVFYFVLALFCAGSGSILGVDDLLVGFSCGVGFSNDGWFTQKTEESHVSNVIDLLLNLAYFVFLGTIIPWEQFNNADMGLSAWRLTVIALLVIFFRRIPIMMALKPLIPDIKTWREALFAGHFGPIGVGAIFVAILARAELESENPVPLSELPPPDAEHYTLIALVWPIVTFLVVTSIIIHGSSVAVFTLGKHINTLTITMSYTTANDDGPSWMNRLPRISSQSRSQARTMSDTDLDELKLPEMPPGTLPPIGIPGHLLRRMREDENGGGGGGGGTKQGSRASSHVSRRRRKKWDDGIGPGGPISQSAIFPQRRSTGDQLSIGGSGGGGGGSPPKTEREDTSATLLTEAEAEAEAKRDSSQDADKEGGETPSPGEREGPGHAREDGSRRPGRVEVYDEGDNIIVEDQSGEVLAVEPQTAGASTPSEQAEALSSRLHSDVGPPSNWTYGALKRRVMDWRDEEIKKRKDKEKEERRHEPARAYQFGNTIIVEDEDGEVVKKYELPSDRQDGGGPDLVNQGLKYMGLSGLVKDGGSGGGGGKTGGGGGREGGPSSSDAAEAERGGSNALSKVASKTAMPSWARRVQSNTTGDAAAQRARKKSVGEEAEEEDDRHIRFTIGGLGQRMTKQGFIREMQKLDKGTRREVVDTSDASNVVKTLAKQDPLPPAGEEEAEKEKETEREREKEGGEGPSPRGKAVARPGDGNSRPSSAGSLRRASSTASSARSSSSFEGLAMGVGRGGGPATSRDVPETAAERRRRLAVLKGVGESSGGEVSETPAERRRREAALGMSSPGRGAVDDDEEEEEEEEDSDDDNTPRVPPVRRGIRFADVPERGRH